MIIELKGHLDTSAVDEVKQVIDAQLAGAQPGEHIEVDCHKLEYISSTGLRILIGIRKAHPDMEVVGVNNDVYNVFEMTGFSRIMTVKKALRKIDLSTCELIGEGGNGAVYRINDEEIVKVSKHSNDDDKMMRERAKVKEAFLMGVPTIISFDMIDCGNGQKGIVMEALDSKSLGMFISENPSVMDSIVPKYVSLFRQANAIHVGSPLFHNIKEWLRSHLTLSHRVINDEEASLLSSLLDEIPDDNCFIHFDGHVGNVLMYGKQENRDLMLIDFGESGIGHPVLEIVGWAFLMLVPEYGKGGAPVERVTGMSHEMNKEFCRRVLAERFHVTDSAELDTLLHHAELIGHIKSAYIAQRWASLMPEGKFFDYLVKDVRYTLARVPEIRLAIRDFVERINGNQ